MSSLKRNSVGTLMAGTPSKGSLKSPQKFKSSIGSGGSSSSGSSGIRKLVIGQSSVDEMPDVS